jgi:Na+/proline symporter
VFAGALVSAILSTVDSALLTASSLVSHNLIVPLNPGMTDRQKVLVARGGVAVFGVLAFVLALFAEGVYALVEEASAFGSAGIFTVIVFGLFSRFGGIYSALTSLGVGITFWVLGAYVLDWPYPYLTSLGASVLAYAFGAIVESRFLKAEETRLSTADR